MIQLTITVHIEPDVEEHGAGAEEVAKAIALRIIEGDAHRIEGSDGGKLRDVNGNTVGHFTWLKDG